MKYRWWALGGVLLLLVGLGLACASDSPQHPARAGHATDEAASGAFPPTGPIELRPALPPTEGTVYELLSSYDGRTEVSEEGLAAHDEGQSLQEVWALQLNYRQLPISSPQGSLASSLVLEALKRRSRTMPPGKQQVLEIGDDRLRVSLDDKVSTDLRGAQPKEDLTPRSLLGKSFAMLVTDDLGNPTSFTLRGVPTAKKLLGSLLLREPVSYLQIPYPDRPVAAGDTWHAKRFLPNPIGRLGLAADIELRLVGFEKIEGAPCAHVSLRAALDQKDVKSALGFPFDEVRYTLSGDAWLDLERGDVALARIEDVAAVSHHRAGGAMVPALVRLRYNSRSALRRLDDEPAGTTWADGTKRFSAVK